MSVRSGCSTATASCSSVSKGATISGLAGGWSVAGGLFNILNTRANAMEYWYVDRLAGEPPGGRADVHVHPLEPRSLRVTLAKTF